MRYNGYDFSHPVLPGPLRPIVAHEVNLETMRRAEVSKNGETRCVFVVLSSGGGAGTTIGRREW